MLKVKELTLLESLKLSLEYSTSRKHQRSLVERINKLEGVPVAVEKPVRKRKVREKQESFL